MTTLRPYQLRAIERLALLARRHRRIVLCGPCGMGKTVLAAGIIESAVRDFGARVLFVAPFIQLINQAHDSFEHICPVNVVRGDDPRTFPLAPLSVASVQTLTRRDLPRADIVIVDECHIASQHVIHNLYPDATIIGLSATPAGLADVYDVIETAATYEELIAGGFVAEPECYGAPAIDLSGVRTAQGDYVVGQLEKVMLGSALVSNVVDAYQRHADGRRTAVFAVGIAHSQALVERFREAGVIAEHIDGETPIETRNEILARLESLETQVVCSVGTLTTGWNQPSVKCGIIARPTKSLVLWRQITGRLLRVFGVVRPIILDLGGNVDRHGFPHEDYEWTLTEAKRRTLAPFKTCPKCFAYQAASNRKCIACGLEFIVETRPPPKELDISLLLRKRPTAGLDARRGEFDRLWAIARAKGHKPGYASALYKEKYGEWPPWSWSQEVKDDFARDATWQARLAAKEEWKRQRDAPLGGDAEPTQESEPVSSVDETSGNAGPDEEFSPSGFAEWLSEMGVER